MIGTDQLKDLSGAFVGPFDLPVAPLGVIAVCDRDSEIEKVNPDMNNVDQGYTVVGQDFGEWFWRLPLSALPSVQHQAATFHGLKLRAVLRPGSGEIPIIVRVRLMDPTHGFQDFDESLTTWNNPHPGVAAGGEVAAAPAPYATASISAELLLTGGLVEWDILPLWNYWYQTLGLTGRIGFMVDAELNADPGHELSYFANFGEYHAGGDPWTVVSV